MQANLAFNTEAGKITPEDLYEAYGITPERVQGLENHLEADNLDFGVVDEIVERITQIQSSIDHICDIAASKIKRKQQYIEWLMYKWSPYLRRYAEMMIPKKADGTLARKNVKLDAGGIYFRKIGGFKVADTDALRKHLDKLSDSELSKIGCYRTININRLKLIKHVAETGEHFPGMGWEPEEALGKLPNRNHQGMVVTHRFDIP